METLGKLLSRMIVPLVAAAIIAAGVGLGFYILVWPQFSSTRSDEPPVLEPTAALVGTELQHFQAEFGSWLTTPESLQLRTMSGVRNLALIQSTGTVSYSSKSVAFSPGPPWTASRPPEITGVAIDGTAVEFRDQRGHRYNLNVSQPFVFANTLGRVYVVDDNREIWSAPLAGLQAVEATSVVDPAILPNDGLSISYGR